MRFRGHVCKYLALRFSINRNRYYFQSDLIIILSYPGDLRNKTRVQGILECNYRKG